MSGEIRVRLDISADQYQRVYAGTARVVQALSTDGRSVQFPAEILRPHITHNGIRGVFVLNYDSNNRFLGIRRDIED